MKPFYGITTAAISEFEHYFIGNLQINLIDATDWDANHLYLEQPYDGRAQPYIDGT